MKKIILLLILVLVSSTFSKAEENSGYFKIADSQINDLFEVKDDASKTLGGVRLHDFTITCQKGVLDLMALQEKVSTTFKKYDNRTISIDIPTIALAPEETAHIVLEITQQNPPFFDANVATFDSKKFDNMLSQSSSPYLLSYVDDQNNKPLTLHNNPYLSAHVVGEVSVPFFISDTYIGTIAPLFDNYTLYINVTVHIVPPR